MVAPDYAEARRALARKIGLGRKAADKAPVTAPVTDGAEKSASRKRLGISAAKEAAQQHLGTVPTEAIEG